MWKVNGRQPPRDGKSLHCLWHVELIRSWVGWACVAHSVLRNIYTEPFIGASSQIPVHLATRFLIDQSEKNNYPSQIPVHLATRFLIDQSEKNNYLWWPCLLTDRNELRNRYKRTFHGCFLPSFGSLGKALSREKIVCNGRLSNLFYLWRPCLFSNRNKMCNLHRRPSVDASYQVSVFLAERFQKILFL
jgi:hypothetical protein